MQRAEQHQPTLPSLSTTIRNPPPPARVENAAQVFNYDKHSSPWRVGDLWFSYLQKGLSPQAVMYKQVRVATIHKSPSFFSLFPRPYFRTLLELTWQIRARPQCGGHPYKEYEPLTVRRSRLTLFAPKLYFIYLFFLGGG